MPSLTFVLPHWLYWAGLIVFPIVAMVMVRRQAGRRVDGYSTGIAYLVWVTGGILGLHRFYLRSMLGLLYLPLFVFILYANAEQRAAREVLSESTNRVEQAQSTLTREGSRLPELEASLDGLRGDVAAAEQGSIAARSAQRKLDRAETRIASARDRLARAEADLEEAGPLVEESRATRSFWNWAAFSGFMLILAFMAFDAVRIPALRRQAERKLAEESAAELQAEAMVDASLAAVDIAELKADHEHITSGWTGWIDRLSYYTGEYVAYWSVIAVFVYYYEVVARYVFNSPTNWAHEGMFLMFGMQYLIAGAYAMLTESHVRVDVFYATMSVRRKALVNILTTVFFFIFAGTLLVTGWIFAVDATRVRETSFTEWQIVYWPFKWAIFVGALLLLLQGIAKLAADIRTLIAGAEPTAAPGA